MLQVRSMNGYCTMFPEFCVQEYVTLFGHGVYSAAADLQKHEFGWVGILRYLTADVQT